MPEPQPSTTLRFGNANTPDSKAITFTMEPHSRTAVNQDSMFEREHRGSVKKHQAAEAAATPDSKRYKPRVSPSDEDTDGGAGCHTPYPALQSEPGSRSDDSGVEGFDFDCYVHATVNEHLERLIAGIKRRVKGECEIALDSAWKAVVSY